MKDKLNDLKKSVGEIKGKASKVTETATKTLGTVKGAVQVGVVTGKAALEKAGQVVNKDAIGQGLEATSKGVEAVARGASFASKAVGTLAEKMQTAAQKVRRLGGSMKDKKKS